MKKNTETVKKYKEYIEPRTQIRRNKTIVADSIEIMIEKLREGVGEDAIEERDLVYYDNETTEINPLANIRTDKEELRLDEQIGKYKFQHEGQPNNEEENPTNESEEGTEGE